MAHTSVFSVDVKGRTGYMSLDVACWELEALGRIRMSFFRCFFPYKACSQGQGNCRLAML